MARIPNDELDRLKREVALVRLVESSGIELKQHGKDYLGLCPFHDDKEPSLVISPDKNLWHCLDACNEGGDVIQWVMKRQGVSFRHAVELLKDGDAALSVPATPVKRNTTAKHSTSLAANPDDQKQLTVVIAYKSRGAGLSRKPGSGSSRTDRTQPLIFWPSAKLPPANTMPSAKWCR